MFEALSRSELIELCRTLRHNLSAGLHVRQVLGQMSERGPLRVRRLAQRMSAVVERGESFQTAIASETRALPKLFRDLAAVGEETGHLPEVLGELERYTILQQQLVRKVVAQCMGPAIQLCMAFLVIALLIFVLGIIAQTRPEGIPAPAVLGQTGAVGAILFLVLSFGSIAAAVALFHLLKPLREKVGFDVMLLRIPGVGPCLRAITLGRFCLALHLSLDAPMAISRALRLSLDVSGNASWANCGKEAARVLRSRKSFTEALASCRVFPTDFLAVVETAEEAGRLPETMRHQADRYYEEATFRLKALSTVITLGVWLVYAIFMIVAIMYIASIYLNALAG